MARTRRQRWMAVLAEADASSLDALLRHAPALPAHQRLRGPEVGLVMVRARAGGGDAFNLGEMTVTRCTIRNERGFVGHAYLAGRDGARAERAAALDASLQDPALCEALERAVVEPLLAAQEARRAALSAQAQATRVDFATLGTMRS